MQPVTPTHDRASEVRRGHNLNFKCEFSSTKPEKSSQKITKACGTRILLHAPKAIKATSLGRKSSARSQFRQHHNSSQWNSLLRLPSLLSSSLSLPSPIAYPSIPLTTTRGRASLLWPAVMVAMASWQRASKPSVTCLRSPTLEVLRQWQDSIVPVAAHAGPWLLMVPLLMVRPHQGHIRGAETFLFFSLSHRCCLSRI